MLVDNNLNDVPFGTCSFSSKECNETYYSVCQPFLGAFEYSWLPDDQFLEEMFTLSFSEEYLISLLIETLVNKY